MKAKTFDATVIFELEQNIMNCWNVVDDLNLLLNCDGYDNDDIKAIARLYQKKFEVMFERFEDLCSEYHQLRNESMVARTVPGREHSDYYYDTDRNKQPEEV